MTYMHEAKITVKLGQFPLDMLRYDACYPATQVDVVAMSEYSSEPYTPQIVTVRKITDSKCNGFTPARWQSFGCDIDVQPVRKL